MTMDMIAVLMIIAAAIIGPSTVVAAVGYSTIKALARNPSASSSLLMGMLVMLIFNEAIVILSLLVFFQVFRPG